MLQRSVAILILSSAIVCGQTFDVASVRVNLENLPNQFTPHRSGDRVTMLNTTLTSVVSFAFHLDAPVYQLSGNLRLPDGWNWYDIEAIAPASTSEDNLRLMFQHLLEDRFQLKFHRETRQVTSYDLVIAKSGSKLKPADPDRKIMIDNKQIPAGRAAVAGGVDGPHLLGKDVPLSELVESLASRLAAPVHDLTGLAGTFDYNVLFSPDGNAAELAAAPSLPSALRQELGLELKANKSTAEILVIDHVDKPSPN
jgi:uncharacterized protein (TIGR03435 family)